MYIPTLPPNLDIDPTPPPPLNERRCRKGKNQSLRAVTFPDEYYPVAFCRLCGERHEL